MHFQMTGHRASCTKPLTPAWERAIFGPSAFYGEVIVAKAMVFIDGTWLYSNVPKLCETYAQPGFRIDFGKLPNLLCDQLYEMMTDEGVDLVRTHLFGSYAASYDPRDAEAVQRRRDFFEMLGSEHRYDVDLYPVDFRGRRLRRADREPNDPFRPEEKCVDVALASTLLYFAAVPNAYDVALVVAGDQDLKPALKMARRLGKRVAIASIRGSCATAFIEDREPEHAKDFDVIWLDDHLAALELKYERIQLACESPLHEGERLVWTTFHPRKGQRFFCPECQARFTRQREADDEVLATRTEAREDRCLVPTDDVLVGTIKRKVTDRGFGFIQAADGEDYFFHFTDLVGDTTFDMIYEGSTVGFQVKRAPSADNAGAAQKVHVVVAQAPVEPDDEG